MKYSDLLNLKAFFVWSTMMVMVAASLQPAIGQEDLTRAAARDLILQSEAIRKRTTSLNMSEEAYEGAKAQGFIKHAPSIGYRAEHVVLTGPDANIATYVRIGAAFKNAVTTLRPVTIDVDVTGVGQTGNPAMRTAEFAWTYPDLTRELRLITTAGGIGVALFRLFDDGWRVDRIEIEDTTERSISTAERDAELAAIASFEALQQRAQEKEKAAIEREQSIKREARHAEKAAQVAVAEAAIREYEASRRARQVIYQREDEYDDDCPGPQCRRSVVRIVVSDVDIEIRTLSRPHPVVEKLWFGDMGPGVPTTKIYEGERPPKIVALLSCNERPHPREKRPMLTVQHCSFGDSTFDFRVPSEAIGREVIAAVSHAAAAWRSRGSHLDPSPIDTLPVSASAGSAVRAPSSTAPAAVDPGHTVPVPATTGALCASVGAQLSAEDMQALAGTLLRGVNRKGEAWEETLLSGTLDQDTRFIDGETLFVNAAC